MTTPKLPGISPVIPLFALLILLSLTADVYAESYRYDDAGRLIAVTYDDGSTITYRYDRNGNRLQRQITAPATRPTSDTGSGGLFGLASGALELTLLLALAGAWRRRCQL